MRLGRWLYEDVYSPWNRRRAFKASCRRLRRVGPEILKKAHAICTEEGIPYFIDYGTLIGCVREHGFIPHDNDIDLGILPGSAEPATVVRLLKHLMAEGFEFKRAFYYKGLITEVACFYKRVSVDFFFNFPEGERFWTNYYETDMDVPAPEHREFVEGIIRTYRPAIPALEPTTMVGAEVMIPANYEEVLVAHYGRGWRVPDPKWGESREGESNARVRIPPEGEVIGWDVLCGLAKA